MTDRRMALLSMLVVLLAVALLITGGYGRAWLSTVCC
jgi:hypothetical protein